MVKHTPCPHCASGVDLFSTYVIARNTYPDRKPEVQIYCPRCGHIFPALNDDKQVHCCGCGLDFNPHLAPAKGAKATCPTCSDSFSIIEAVRAFDQPPAHRLYGKLLLTPEGTKKYLPATLQDLEAYEQCVKLLQHELEQGTIQNQPLFRCR